VKVKGATPLHFRRRTREEIEIGAETWVPYHAKVALPAQGAPGGQIGGPAL
jgi:hypothetical protein